MKHKSTLRRLLSFVRPYKRFLIFALIASAINIIFTLWTPVLIGQAIDAMIGPHKVKFALLFQKLILIGISAGMTALFAFLLTRFSNHLTYNITRDLREKLFKKYHSLPLSYIDSHSHGDLMARMIADIDLISDGLLQGFTNLFSGVCTILGTILFMVAINVKVALVVIILTPLSLIVSSIIASKVYKYFQIQLKDRGDLSGYVEEMIGSQKVITAFSHEEESKKDFEVLNQRLLKSGIKSQFLGALVNPTTRFVNAIVYGSVCLFGAFTVIGGGMTVGALSSFLTYANQYTKPFNDISNVFTQLETALACADRVFKILDEEDLKEFATEHGSFYIIPSSIHELIFLTLNGCRQDSDEISDMIQSINDEVVNPEEVLGDHAYYYDADTDTLYSEYGGDEMLIEAVAPAA